MKLNSFYTLLSFTFVSLQAFAAPHDPRDNNDQEAWLELHNQERGQNGAGELTWDESLAQKAEESAKQCKLKASAGQNAGYGGSPDEVFKLWADTAGNYPDNASKATPWIQIVYNSASSVGCASAPCDNKVLNVCLYNTPIDKDYANQVEGGKGGGKKKSPSKNIAIPPLPKGGKHKQEKEKEEEKEEEKEGAKHKKEKEKEGNVGEDQQEKKESKKQKQKEGGDGGEEMNDNLKQAQDAILGFEGKIDKKGGDPHHITDSWHNKRDIEQM
uniref:Pathogenesis-related protein 1 n=1 Tax=Moniliophthora perniciosa TaxID=153609 RepID=A0A8E6Y9F8_MONPR|nr:pathogenesis-related protein 1 [Moniliophthora perniciosa]